MDLKGLHGRLYSNMFQQLLDIQDFQSLTGRLDRARFGWVTGKHIPSALWILWMRFPACWSCGQPLARTYHLGLPGGLDSPMVLVGGQGLEYNGFFGPRGRYFLSTEVLRSYYYETIIWAYRGPQFSYGIGWVARGQIWRYLRNPVRMFLVCVEFCKAASTKISFGLYRGPQFSYGFCLVAES